MTDREKVIKGLKQHRDGQFHSCDNCPYVNDTSCQLKLYSDALALLEEQEKRNEPVNAVTPNSNYLIVCPKCEAVINVIHIPKYRGYCGQAVKRDG